MTRKLSDADVDKVLKLFDASGRRIQRLMVVELLWQLVEAERQLVSTRKALDAAENGVAQ